MLALLSLTTMVGAPSEAAQPSVNWTYPSANMFGTGTVSQTQVTPATVGSLQLAWILPFAASGPVRGLTFLGEGAIAPPLVVSGVVYVMTNDLTIMALNAEDGSTIWSYQPQLNTTGLPLSDLAGHVHGITYYEGNIWANLPDCSALSLNALTGAVVEHITRICSGIPGNDGKYNYSGTPPVFYKDIFIWSGSDDSSGTDSGRGFIAGYNITTGSLLWRWYVSPPAGGEIDWDTDECPPQTCHGNVAPYPGDWGTLGYTNGTTRAGGGPDWDQMAVDPTDGLVFAGTANPAPEGNATYRPGPDLFSDSIVALNATDGHMLWYFQSTPHDLYDFDCGWNVALANITVSGQNETAVIKQCKNGYVYALDAQTGKLIWQFDPPTVARLNTPNADFTSTGTYNATEKWNDYPKAGTIEQCPGIEGGIESDIAIAYGRVFVATHNYCTFVTVGPVSEIGPSYVGFSSAVPDQESANTTIYALDASSGNVDWKYSVPGVPYRGWLTATGGMVFASSLDGYIIALDAKSGAVDGSFYVGAGLYEGVTVGTSSAGNVMLFQLLSSPSYSNSTQGVPGALLALDLPQSSTSSLEVYLPWVLAAVFGAGFTVLVAARFLQPRKPSGVDPSHARGRPATARMHPCRSHH